MTSDPEDSVIRQDLVWRPGPKQEAALARMVFNALDEGVLVQGPLGKVATANPAAARILGIPLDDLIGSHTDQLPGPLLRGDGTPMPRDELPGRRAIRTGEPQLNVLMGIGSRDGAARWVEVNARPLQFKGETFAVVSSIRDVTSRHEAETALRHAERRQRVVLEHAVGGYVIVDDDGELVDGSSSVFAWWDERSATQAVLGYDDMHPEDRAPMSDVIEQAKASPGIPQRAELRAETDTGETRWIELTATDQRGDPAVGGIVVNFTDITERKTAAEALAHQARHDPVTGLPNRRMLTDRLEHALARAHRNGTLVGVVFFDVDHFKLVNDSLGHQAGDRVLQELASRFRMGARDSDTVVRFGGDEFVLVCEDLDGIDEVIEVAERLTALIEEPQDIDRAERVVTVSSGVAISHDGSTASSLLSDADAAMNLAKERGRAHVEVFSDELRSEATRRLELDSALRRALSRHEFHLEYQPVLTVTTGEPVGCEALLRWDIPGLGRISPSEFIPLAERSGLIVPIGAWVIGEAVRQMAEWHREVPGARGLWMAINLSPRQLGDADLVEVITHALDETGLDPASLHLEVTESAIIEDMAASVQRLTDLKALGVHIDVDDFGTGYSSLSYLKRLPIDTLKVDQSFTDGLGTDPDDSAIVRAIISLGRALDLHLIAEGVETPTQLAELESLGCDLAQGYLFSRPIEPQVFTRWLAEHASRSTGN